MRLFARFVSTANTHATLAHRRRSAGGVGVITTRGLRRRRDPKMCDCIEKETKRLQALFEPDETVFIDVLANPACTYTVLKRINRKKPRNKPKVTLYANKFCPFCGERYEKYNGGAIDG